MQRARKSFIVRDLARKLHLLTVNQSLGILSINLWAFVAFPLYVIFNRATENKTSHGSWNVQQKEWTYLGLGEMLYQFSTLQIGGSAELIVKEQGLGFSVLGRIMT